MQYQTAWQSILIQALGEDDRTHFVKPTRLRGLGLGLEFAGLQSSLVAGHGAVKFKSSGKKNDTPSYLKLC